MQEHQILEMLADFFNGRNRFRAVNDYWGMAASQQDNVFVEYFEKLDEPTKVEIGRVIVLGMRGKLQEMKPYVARLAYLMSGLCFRKFRSTFHPYLEALEEEFNRPMNIQSWINSDDKPILPRGDEFRADYHYAIVLLRVLKKLKSKRVAETHRHLLKKAKSERFKRMLGRPRLE